MIGAHTLQPKKRDNRKRPMCEYKKGDISLMSSPSTPVPARAVAADAAG